MRCGTACLQMGCEYFGSEVQDDRNTFRSTIIILIILIILRVSKRKKYRRNLVVSNNRCTFAVAFKERDLAQLVAHTSGGREVAGSSPVIPTFSEVSG